MENLARAIQQAHYLALAAKSRLRAERAEQMLKPGLAADHMNLATGYEPVAQSAGVLSGFPGRQVPI